MYKVVQILQSVRHRLLHIKRHTQEGRYQMRALQGRSTLNQLLLQALTHVLRRQERKNLDFETLEQDTL